MKPMRLALLAMCLPAVAPAADDFKAADRTLRVRGLLLKHCAACHGEKAGEGRLSVVDHPSLLKTRPVPTVRPREVAASQLLTLVEEGSMPPGNRPKLSDEEITLLREWIAEGAGAYPPSFRDEFAWTVIAEDATKLPPADLPTTRYLTMHHLAGDGGTGDFAATRADWLRQVRRFVGAGEKALLPIDPTGMVFRLNLKEIGWDRQPFEELDSTGMIRPGSKVTADIFDVFLLDYPHGRFPVGTPVGDALAGGFVSKAKMLRPVPFVHADWFVHLLSASKLGGDIVTLLTPTGKPIPEGFADKTARPAPPRPAGDDTTPVPAVDAWTLNDPKPQPPGVEGVEFYLTDGKGKEKTVFLQGEKLFVYLKTDAPVYFEVLWENSDAVADTWSKRVTSHLGPGPAEYEMSDEIGAATGKERLTLFVSPREFSGGQAWRSKNPDPKSVDRFVHPFFLFDAKEGKYSFQPSSVGIERRSKEIEIKIKKK